MAALGASVQAGEPRILQHFDVGRFDRASVACVPAQHYVQFPGFDEVPTGIGAVTTAPGPRVKHGHALS